VAQAQTTDDDGEFGSGVKETLVRFGKSPQGFLLGAVLSPLLSGLNDVVVRFLNLIRFVFVGDGPGLEGTLGIADIPLFMGEKVLAVGATVGGSAADGTGILGVVDTIVQALIDIATIGGPLAPIILAGETVLVVWVLAVIARRTILVIADAVPGLAGILGT